MWLEVVKMTEKTKEQEPKFSLRNYYEKAKDLFRRSAIEVAICAVLGAGIGALADNLGDKYGWYEKRGRMADDFRRTLKDYYITGVR